MFRAPFFYLSPSFHPPGSKLPPSNLHDPFIHDGQTWKRRPSKDGIIPTTHSLEPQFSIPKRFLLLNSIGGIWCLKPGPIPHHKPLKRAGNNDDSRKENAGHDHVLWCKYIGCDFQGKVLFNWIWCNLMRGRMGSSFSCSNLMTPRTRKTMRVRPLGHKYVEFPFGFL